MDIQKTLSSSGLKCTKQRIAVMEVLLSSSGPITAEDIHLRVNEMSLSTVYRTVETLCNKHILAKHTIQDSDKFYYDIVTEKHHHYAICLGCKSMRYIDHCPVHTSDIDGFTVTGHKLELYGYCNKCKNKNSVSN